MRNVSYNVDEEQGLVGEPDYLIAPKTKYGAMARPALCVIEAKKDDFDGGWTQAWSEMVASSLLGASVCYGIVTTGAIWQFGKLDGGRFIIDPRHLSATTELQRVFNTVNWVFDEISIINEGREGFGSRAANDVKSMTAKSCLASVITSVILTGIAGAVWRLIDVGQFDVHSRITFV